MRGRILAAALTLALFTPCAVAACSGGGLDFYDVKGNTGDDVLFIVDKYNRDGISECDPVVLADKLRHRRYKEIWLWSGGGSVKAGIDMGVMIRRNGPFVTRVPSVERVRKAILGRDALSLSDKPWARLEKRIRERRSPSGFALLPVCASACVMVFAGGDIRLADRPRTIGLHSMDGDDYQSGVRVSADWTRHMIQMGVSGDFMERATRTPPDQMEFLSTADLRDLYLLNYPEMWPRDELGRSLTVRLR